MSDNDSHDEAHDDIDRQLRDRAARWRREHPADRSLAAFLPSRATPDRSFSRQEARRG